MLAGGPWAARWAFYAMLAYLVAGAIVAVIGAVLGDLRLALVPVVFLLPVCVVLSLVIGVAFRRAERSPDGSP